MVYIEYYQDIVGKVNSQKLQKWPNDGTFLCIKLTINHLLQLEVVIRQVDVADLTHVFQNHLMVKNLFMVN